MAVVCGQPAAVIDGVFDAVGDVVKLIDGPQFTRDLLKKFADLVAQAQRQQITPDDLEREATKLDPNSVRQLPRSERYLPDQFRCRRVVEDECGLSAATSLMPRACSLELGVLSSQCLESQLALHNPQCSYQTQASLPFNLTESGD
jgi:hypothetical protein